MEEIAVVLPSLFSGTVVGLLLVFWLGRYATAFLYQDDAQDPVMLAIVAVVLIGASAAGAFVPARRVDPPTTLRAE